MFTGRLRNPERPGGLPTAHSSKQPWAPLTLPSPRRPRKRTAPGSPARTAARRPRARCPREPARRSPAKPTPSAAGASAAATTAAPTPAWRPCRPLPVGAPGWGNGEAAGGQGRGRGAQVNCPPGPAPRSGLAGTRVAGPSGSQLQAAPRKRAPGERTPPVRMGETSH